MTPGQYDEVGSSRTDTNVNRREFLRDAAVAGAGLTVAASSLGAAEPTTEGLPTRVLGRTGQRVTILGLGTAPIGEGPPDVQEAAKVFGAVIDAGVNYVDTARGYGNAEEALGLLVPKRRDRIFLVTKCWTDSAEGAEKSLSESLRRLKTDHVDLCHIHHVGGKDVDRVLAKAGILEYLLKQKEAGKIRFIGISGHARSSRFVRVIETGQIDVVMTILNYADRNTYEFESKVLPAARKQNMGIMAMKAYVGIKGGFPNHRRGFVGCVTEPALLPKALAYSLDLEGVAGAVVGPYTLEQGLQNVEFARTYKRLTDTERAEMIALGGKLATGLGPRYGPVT